MFNLQDPFFLPLWRRALLTVFLFGWTVFEIVSQSWSWAVLIGALCAYVAYQFFIVWNPDDWDK